MVIKPKNGIGYEEVDCKVSAFDEWLEEQPEPVKQKVYAHISLLKKAVPTMGEKSAKLLLIEVYLLTRRKIQIEQKYGELEA